MINKESFVYVRTHKTKYLLYLDERNLLFSLLLQTMGTTLLPIPIQRPRIYDLMVYDSPRTTGYNRRFRMEPRHGLIRYKFNHLLTIISRGPRRSHQRTSSKRSLIQSDLAPRYSDNTPKGLKTDNEINNLALYTKQGESSKMSFNISAKIEGFIAILLMVFLLPVMASAIVVVSTDANFSSIPGLSQILYLVLIVLIFVIIVMAIGLIKHK